MRGRTNIGGGGIAINATPQQKTIKGGNIIAGDFVEYYSEPSYIEQGQPINFVFSIGDYDIAQVGNALNMLAAFKDGEQKFIYSGYNCKYVAKYNDFIVFVDRTSGVNTLGVLSISSNGFTLVSSLRTTGDTSYGSYETGIWCGGGKVCYCRTGSSNKGAIGIADISNTGALSNFVFTADAGSMNGYDYYTKIIGFYNGTFYILIPNENFIYSITINGSNNATISSWVSCSVRSTRIIYRKDDKIFFAGYEKDPNASSYEYYKYRGFITIVNFVTGNIIKKILPDHGEVLSWIKDNKFLMVGKIETRVTFGDNYQRYIPNMLKLCSFNDQTFEITVLDTLTLDVDYTQPSTSSLPIGTTITFYDLFVEQVQENVAICDLALLYSQCKLQYKWTFTKSSSSSSSSVDTITDYNLYKYDIENNRIQDPSTRQYVKPYHDGGNPIGVAKDSGAIDDIIDVYIPVASS